MQYNYCCVFIIVYLSIYKNCLMFELELYKDLHDEYAFHEWTGEWI